MIILAVAFTLLRGMLPHATGYIAEIEKGISSQIGLPVSIGSLDAEMHWFTPRLKVLDLVIYKEDGKDKLISLTEATISLAYYESLRFMMPVAGTVSLHGAELFIERHPHGKWVIQGFELYERESSRDSEELIELILSADIALIDSRIHWRDYTGGSRDIDFDDATVRLANYLDSQFVEVDVKLPADLGQRFRIVAQLNGDLRDLRSLEVKLQVNGTGLVFDNWVKTTRIKDFVRGSGKLDVSLWTHISDARILRFASDINATDLQLANIDNRRKTWRANSLKTKLYWRALDQQGWQLDIRDLHMQIGNSKWQDNTSIIVANRDKDWRVAASYLKPSDILPLLHVLPDGIDISAVTANADYVPAGEFFDFEAIAGLTESPTLQLSTRFNDVAVVLADRGISVNGLDGELAITNQGSELMLASNNVRADTGGLLRWPVQLDRLEGKLAIQLDEDKLSLETPALVVNNQHMQTITRLHAEIYSDKKVFLDMQTDLANGKGEYAHRYIPTSIVPEGLLDWLDNAFLGGYVPSGSFLFRGIANDYPFRECQGVMQVLFDVVDGTLHFLDGWPDVHNAAATVRFHNASLSVENARSYEANGSRAMLNAFIPDLKDALLSINANIEAPADEVQQYVWNSGLDPILGRAAEHVQASGQTEIELDLDVPLGKIRKAEQQLQVDGKVKFIDNELFFPVTDYQLTDLNGKLAFTTTSVYGEDIEAKFYGQPVAIRVATTQDGPNPETRFYLSGTWAIDTLLSVFDWHYPALLDGQSHWDVVMRVPLKDTDYDLRFDASSDLVGLKIGFSDIVSKTAEHRTPVSIEYKILGDAHSVDVVSTDLLDLNATLDEDENWRFDVASPVITGEGIINANIDPDTTALVDLDFLNLTAFMIANHGSEGKWNLKASNVPSLRVEIDRFVWNDWKLSNVEIATDNHPRGMVVNTIKVNDPHLQINGKGSWLRRSWRLDEETTFSFKLTSSNLGDTLQNLGYSRYVDKSNMQAALHWHWPGAPYNFDWESLSGNTSVELDKGIISDVEPGAGGRFLGLFNLLHLPKRLGLDFADVYKKGFVFESVTGTYVFGSGDAITQDTEISASAADLTMMGRIGVADQDYDLVTIVRPHSSVATFAGGYLVAGPTIGVGLALLQEIFDLDLLGKDIYTIKGTWEEPAVKRITDDADDESEDLSDDFD
ncbi:MAG: hypothetical protein KJP15_02085 [Gammaproteobacteria bacterium]|nr:hypothetical protein [Gammaproteobacteria bacterium]